jgi:phytanoyl-CoA hydroxylase
MTTGPTDAATLERFEADGYLVLEDFFPSDEAAALITRADELVAAFKPDEVTRSIFSTNEQTRTSDDYFLASGDRISFFFEPEAFDSNGNLQVPLDRAINKFGHAQHDLDPVFDDFSRHQRLADLADRLGVGGHALVQSMLIFKQPGIGGEVSSHTDHTFLWTEPRSVVGFWFALEDATLDNGCLWALPGGHSRKPVRRFRRAPGGGTTMEVLGDEPPAGGAEAGFVPLEVRSGTLIVLDGLLPHYSLANRSQRRRAAYTLHAIDPTAHYPSDNWLQRNDLPLRGFRDRR